MEQTLIEFRQDAGPKTARREDQWNPDGLKYIGSRREDLNFALSVLDAYRIKISHTYNKLSSLSNSRTRLLPHQIEATHRVVNALRPRFILGDEVGLGKTIEAGLIMKELMLRRGYKRVFVAVPAPLAVQWKQEMKNKFNEDFVILNRKSYKEISSSWNKYPRIIASIDFVKNPNYAEDILKARWDIAVFDEAHRLRRDYSKTTKAYNFAEQLADRTDALLLLSATPFRGKLEELFYLVRLVDSHLLGPHSSFVQEYMIGPGDGGERPASDIRERVSKILIRRRKVEVGGFTKRFAATIRFDLTVEERAFYDATTEYVKREYNLAMQQKNRAVGFIMIVFQKLLDSSTRALLRALEKRKAMLEQKMHSIGSSLYGSMNGNPFLDENGYRLRLDDLEEMDEFEELEDHLEDLDESDQGMSLKDLRKEILTLNHLVSLGRIISQDRKLIKLKETINRLKKEGSKKFIIFTQFRTTQDYLNDNLSDDYLVTLFHGSLNMQQKEDACSDFKNKTEIFIATEAGGEGRNLQFTNILINYDLPWSPLKVEQRIGRVHRFGQQKDVYIFNFSTRDTVAERVLEVLENKIRLFEESIGPSDAILGAVEDEGNFQKFLMEFVSGRKTKSDFDNELNSMMEIARNGYSRLNDLVTPQLVDFNLDDYYAYSKENRSMENDEIEKITLNYLEQKGDDDYRLEKDDEHYIYYSIPDGLKKPATFSSEKALESDRLEFLAAGHPLVDRALDFFLGHRDRKTIQTIPATKEMPENGFYFISMVTYKNGLSRAELLSCWITDSRPEKTTIPDELLIRPGMRAKEFDHGLDRLKISGSLEDIDGRKLKKASEIALEKMKSVSEERGAKLHKELHTIFKKEEYKLEISYYKKIRQLEEKRDRQKMRYRNDPRTEIRASLTRTENELIRTRQEMDLHLERIRREGRVDARLELIQIYRVLSYKK